MYRKLSIALVVCCAGCVNVDKWYQEKGQYLVKDATNKVLDEGKEWAKENVKDLTKALIENGVEGAKEAALKILENTEVKKKAEIDDVLKLYGKHWQDFDSNSDQVLDTKELLELDKFYLSTSLKELLKETVSIEIVEKIVKDTIGGKDIVSSVKDATNQPIQDSKIKDNLITIFGASGVLAALYMLGRKKNGNAT